MLRSMFLDVQPGSWVPISNVAALSFLLRSVIARAVRSGVRLVCFSVSTSLVADKNPPQHQSKTVAEYSIFIMLRL